MGRAGCEASPEEAGGWLNQACLRRRCCRSCWASCRSPPFVPVSFTTGWRAISTGKQARGGGGDVAYRPIRHTRCRVELDLCCLLDQSLMLMHVVECSAAPGMTHRYGCISQVEAVKLCNAKHGWHKLLSHRVSTLADVVLYEDKFSPVGLENIFRQECYFKATLCNFFTLK